MADDIEDRTDRVTWNPDDLEVVEAAEDTWHLSYKHEDGDDVLVQDMDGLMQHFLHTGETDLQGALDRFMQMPEAKLMPQHLHAELQNAGVLRD